MSAEKVQKLVEGIVISDKMQKTIVVRVARKEKHRKYGKMIEKQTILYAHDEHDRGKEGNKVLIKERAPVSKTKAWELVEVVDSKG